MQAHTHHMQAHTIRRYTCRHTHDMQAQTHTICRHTLTNTDTGESPAGRPGFPIPNKPDGFCGREATLMKTADRGSHTHYMQAGTHYTHEAHTLHAGRHTLHT